MSQCKHYPTTAVLIGLVVASGTSVMAASLSQFTGLDPNMVIRLDPNDLQFPGDWQVRQGQDVYRKEGAEIVPWTREAALPSPDNAALLYYQAFLLYPTPDVATVVGMRVVLGGAEPDGQIRGYLGNCRTMIHMAEIASRIPRCTWGIRYLDPKGFGEMSLLAQIRQLALVLAVDARTLASDGHYDAAFARGLMLRRLARHTGDDTMLAYSFSLAADYLAQGAMQYALGLMPPDVDSLRRLRGQLASVPGAPGSLQKAMQADLDLVLERMRNDNWVLEWTRQELVRKATDRQAKEKVSTLTDEDILALGRDPYQRFLHDISQVMDSDMAYSQKYAEIDSRTNQLIADHGDDPPASAVMGYSDVYVNGIVLRYSLFIRHAAGYNALKTAVEVYLARAQTGQLPQTLPAHTPKDPFSDQPFEYEITPDGFILRCRAKDLYGTRIWQYEFKIHPAN
jgi:hypothetical protein